MTELALILVATVLVNNFVLVKFLGLCPFMGVSRKIETATGMALATTFVLTLSSVCSYVVNAYLLEPLALEHRFGGQGKGRTRHLSDARVSRVMSSLSTV